MKPNEMSVRDYMAMNFACAIIQSNKSATEWPESTAQSAYELADKMLEYGKKTEPKEDYKAKVLDIYSNASAVSVSKNRIGIRLRPELDYLFEHGETEALAWELTYKRLMKHP